MHLVFLQSLGHIVFHTIVGLFCSKRCLSVKAGDLTGYDSVKLNNRPDISEVVVQALELRTPH
jgi:hypothetical protein